MDACPHASDRRRLRLHLAALGVEPLLSVVAETSPSAAARIRGVELADLADDGATRRLAITTTDRLWIEAESVIGPLLPVRVAASVTPASFGHLSYLLAAAPDVGRSFAALARHYGLLGNATRHHLTSGRHVRLDIELRGTPRPACVETFAAAVVVAFLRRETEGRVVPRAVHLPCARPEPRVAEAFARAFGRAPQYGARGVAVEFAPEDLAVPLRGAAPVLLRLLTEHAELVHARSDLAEIAARVRDAIAASGPRVGIRAAEIAEALGVSERSLRRRLAGAATSFGAELDAVLHERARALLADATVEEVAATLGYADAAALRRAHRRWTGTSPRASLTARAS